jgi:cyclophilin family peptidyl-prolyl cis-trans isomerase
MKTYYLQLLILSIFILSGTQCSSGTEKPRELSTSELILQTDYGVMRFRLYDETPEHRDNFLKLVEEGFYEDLLFHRVIQNFMIQGGDPESRNAGSGARLGNGGPGYTLPAEIVPGLIHKKGAIASARMGDNVNPEQRSSGSQFYIVHGSVFTDDQLDETEKRINNMRLQNLFFRIFEEEKAAAFEKDDPVDMDAIGKMSQEKAMEQFQGMKAFVFTPEQREIYKTIGGAPHLDGSYTVFGEVVEGIDVIDKIASQPVDGNNRPLKDVKMSIRLSGK